MKKGDLVVTALWLVVALGGLVVAAVAAVLG
jgi:hypothetical protein